MSRRGGQGQDVNALKAKIFVGGLPPSLTNEALREFFAKWGAVKESQILVNRETGRVRFPSSPRAREKPRHGARAALRARQLRSRARTGPRSAANALPRSPGSPPLILPSVPLAAHPPPPPRTPAFPPSVARFRIRHLYGCRVCLEGYRRGDGRRQCAWCTPRLARALRLIAWTRGPPHPATPPTPKRVQSGQIFHKLQGKNVEVKRAWMISALRPRQTRPSPISLNSRLTPQHF